MKTHGKQEESCEERERKQYLDLKANNPQNNSKSTACQEQPLVSTKLTLSATANADIGLRMPYKHEVSGHNLVIAIDQDIPQTDSPDKNHFRAHNTLQLKLTTQIQANNLKHLQPSKQNQQIGCQFMRPVQRLTTKLKVNSNAFVVQNKRVSQHCRQDIVNRMFALVQNDLILIANKLQHASRFCFAKHARAVREAVLCMFSLLLQFPQHKRTSVCTLPQTVPEMASRHLGIQNLKKI